MKNFFELRKNTIFSILIACFAVLYSCFYLNMFDHWWFEDDTIQFFAVSKIQNPFSLFFDPNTIRQFGIYLVPMQFLSYWLDVKLAGFSPTAAYVHSLLSFIITSVLIYLTINGFLKKHAISFVIAVLWMLLPSTIVVNNFLATRHYMEGLLFSILAIWLYQKSLVNKEHNILFLAGVLLSTLIAILFKEIYVATLPTFLFLYSISKKQYQFTLILVSFIVMYVPYRIWMVGIHVSHDQPLLNIYQYLRFLRLLPKMFAASWTSYVLLLVFILLIYRYGRNNAAFVKSALFFIILSIVALGSVFPISYALLHTINRPGTWYRGVFLINTIFLLFGGYLLTTLISNRLMIVFLCFASCVLSFGAHRTHILWDKMMSSAKREAMFYLQNSNRLLYSEEPAFWFIPGVHSMYGVSCTHYLLKFHEDSELAKQMLNEFDTIWSYQEGIFKPNTKLYSDLSNKFDSKTH